MKFVIIAAFALVAVVSCAPAQPDEVKIIRSEVDQQPEGSYVANSETSDGTKRNEVGELKTVTNDENKPQTVVVVRGSYQYIDPEGNSHGINYYADETGFHAEGEDVPKEVSARR